MTCPGTELLVHREDHNWIGYRKQKVWEVIIGGTGQWRRVQVHYVSHMDL